MNNEILIFLDKLRKSGETNMYGAIPYIMAAYPELNYEEAKYYLSTWMRTFSERVKRGEAIE